LKQAMYIHVIPGITLFRRAHMMLKALIIPHCKPLLHKANNKIIGKSIKRGNPHRNKNTNIVLVNAY
jgi:hypothetical protein